MIIFLKLPRVLITIYLSQMIILSCTDDQQFQEVVQQNRANENNNQNYNQQGNEQNYNLQDENQSNDNTEKQNQDEQYSSDQQNIENNDYQGQSQEFNADDSSPFEDNEYQSDEPNQTVYPEGNRITNKSEVNNSNFPQENLRSDNTYDDGGDNQQQVNRALEPENRSAGYSMKSESQLSFADDTLSADEDLDVEASRFRLIWVGLDYRINEAKIKIEIMTEGNPKYALFQESNQKGQAELVVRFYETGLRKKVSRDIDSSEFRGPIAYIRMRENLSEGSSDVVMTLRDQVKPKVLAEQGNILLTLEIPEKYYGNSSIGSVDNNLAKVISERKILTEFLQGSELPQGIEPPSQTGDSFDDMKEEDGDFVEIPEDVSNADDSTEELYEGGLPNNDFDNSDVAELERNNSLNGAGNYVEEDNSTVNSYSNDQSNTDQDIDQSYDGYNQQGNQVSNNYNQGSNNYNQGSNNYNQGSNNYNQGSNNYNQGSNNYNQGSSNYNQGSSNYNQQGKRGSDNYNQGDNNYDQNYDKDDLIEQNLDDFDDGNGESEYNDNKFEVEVRRKSGLIVSSVFSIISVAQDEYDLSDDSYNDNQSLQQNNQYQESEYDNALNQNEAQQVYTQQGAENNFIADQYSESDENVVDQQSQSQISSGNGNVSSGNGNVSSGNGNVSSGNGNVNTNTVDQSANTYDPTDQIGLGNNTQYIPQENTDAINTQYDEKFVSSANQEAEYIDLLGDETTGQEDPDSIITGARDVIKPVRMEFKDADLRDVITILGQENNTNFIYKENAVKDVKVNLSLKDVSWTDALRAILETHGMGFIQLPGNVIRIDKIGDLQVERQDVRKAKMEARQLIPTKVMMMALSHAKAEDLKKMLDEIIDKEIDPRSKVSTDKRSNTLILEAIPEVLERMKAVIVRLDKPTSQVKIETRIIEVRESDKNNFGVQWGLNNNVSGSTGLGFGNLNFPNSVSSNWTIAAPLENPTGKSSISLGSINNLLELDLMLEWEETKENTKILQTTSTIVLDNEKAEIASGLEETVAVIDGGESEIITIEYLLNLEVTPQITADGTVLLDVFVETADPTKEDTVGLFGRQTKRVKTKMLKRSGETAVIGGVYTSQNDKVERGVPVLMHIPIIGGLFRSKSDTLVKKEIIIIITPTILDSTSGPSNDGMIGTGSVAKSNSYDQTGNNYADNQSDSNLGDYGSEDNNSYPGDQLNENPNQVYNQNNDQEYSQGNNQNNDQEYNQNNNQGNNQNNDQEYNQNNNQGNNQNNDQEYNQNNNQGNNQNNDQEYNQNNNQGYNQNNGEGDQQSNDQQYEQND